MAEYRTDEQYKDICENMSNGNWSDAALICANAGFYANDLKNKYEEGAEGSELIDDLWDFAELIEMAAKYRNI
jgi:hypothetical protein